MTFYELTGAETRDSLDRRITAAVQRLTRSRQGGCGPDLRIPNILHLMDLKREGYSVKHYRAACEYAPGSRELRHGR